MGEDNPDVDDDDEQPLYCYCKTAEEPGNCDIEWFHFSCVGITEDPNSDEEWYCDECKKTLCV